MAFVPIGRDGDGPLPSWSPSPEKERFDEWKKYNGCGKCGGRGIIEVIVGYEIKQGWFGPKRKEKFVYQSCSDCFGWGGPVRSCPDCKGKKNITKEYTDFNDCRIVQESCGPCSGTGRTSCPMCRTEGVVCSECKGERIISQKIYGTKVQTYTCGKCIIRAGEEPTGYVPDFKDWEYSKDYIRSGLI